MTHGIHMLQQPLLKGCGDGRLLSLYSYQKSALTRLTWAVRKGSGISISKWFVKILRILVARKMLLGEQRYSCSDAYLRHNEWSASFACRTGDFDDMTRESVRRCPSAGAGAKLYGMANGLATMPPKAAQKAAGRGCKIAQTLTFSVLNLIQPIHSPRLDRLQYSTLLLSLGNNCRNSFRDQ